MSGGTIRRLRMLQRLGGLAALVVTALIWGLAFSAQRQGSQFLSANVFLALRSWIGCAALLPVIALLDRWRGPAPAARGEGAAAKNRRLLTAGLLCGGVLFAASLLQQLGLASVSAGKSGFLTALYIVMVPVLGIFFHRRTGWLLWLAVGIVLFGSWLLCGAAAGGSSSVLGEILLIGGAFCYAVHIMIVDRCVGGLDCVRLSFLQFLATAILSTLAALLLRESWSPVLIRQALGALLFCGIGSTGIAYTLQIVGQKFVHPVTASLIMCLESVFSVLGGWFFLNELLSGRELAGCALILTAVILAQLPAAKKSEKACQISGKAS